MAEKLHLPPELPSASTTLTAQCYCKSVHYTLTLPSHALPLPVHICHCSICRRTTGSLASIHALLPSGIAFVAPSSMDSLTGYVHDPKAVGERFFCSTCGCHIGDRDRQPDENGQKTWTVATSIFDRHDEEVFQIRMLAMTKSSPGWGLYQWLPSINNRELEVRDAPFPKSPFSPLANEPPKPEVDGEGNDVLRAKCHCGGVSFTIPRPHAQGYPKTPSSKSAPSDWTPTSGSPA